MSKLELRILGSQRACKCEKCAPATQPTEQVAAPPDLKAAIAAANAQPTEQRNLTEDKPFDMAACIRAGQPEVR